MKRTPLRRVPMKRRPPKNRQPFPDGLREQVINRDGMCIIAIAERELGLSGHVCCDMNGPHPSNDKSRLTYDHFNTVPGGIRGLRAPHTPENGTAMCLKSNVDGPPAWVREFQRAYTRRLYAKKAA